MKSGGMMKPSLSVIIGGEKPAGGDSEKSSGIGDMLIEAIKSGDGKAVEDALAAFCDSHAADYEADENESEEN